MRALAAAELLEVWERGQAEPPLRRALLLLTAACEEAPAAEVAQWTIGTRDAALLRLRERLFGGKLASWTECPACRERVEFELGCGELLHAAGEPAGTSPLRARVGDYEVIFRLPNSLDLEALVPGSSAESNRLRLLARCVLEVRQGNEPVPAAEMPAELATAVAEGMAKADPQAELRLTLGCPACNFSWSATLDVVSYFWSEIHSWATRLLREVHELALAYGWREADIVALSPWRRQNYLNLVRG